MLINDDITLKCNHNTNIINNNNNNTNTNTMNDETIIKDNKNLIYIGDIIMFGIKFQYCKISSVKC